MKMKSSRAPGDRLEVQRKSQSNSALGSVSDRRHRKADVPQKLQEIKEFPDSDLKKNKSFNPNNMPSLPSQMSSLTYSDDKKTLNLGHHASTLTKKSQQSEMSKTFLSSNQPSYMKNTMSSKVKDRAIQENEAQDIMKKTVEAKNKTVDPKKKQSFAQLKPGVPAINPDGTPSKQKLMQSQVQQYADESDGDKFISSSLNMNDTQPMFSQAQTLRPQETSVGLLLNPQGSSDQSNGNLPSQIFAAMPSATAKKTRVSFNMFDDGNSQQPQSQQPIDRTLQNQLLEMVQLDKKFAERMEQMQEQFQHMQEAFNTLKSSFYDSKLEQEKSQPLEEKLEDIVTAVVENIMQREVQKMKEDMGKDMQTNSQAVVQQMSQLMQVQSSQMQSIQVQQMSGFTKYLEVMANSMKEIQLQNQQAKKDHMLDDQNVQGILSCLETIQNQQDDMQEQFSYGKKWINNKFTRQAKQDSRNRRQNQRINYIFAVGDQRSSQQIEEQIHQIIPQYTSQTTGPTIQKGDSDLTNAIVQEYKGSEGFNKDLENTEMMQTAPMKEQHIITDTTPLQLDSVVDDLDDSADQLSRQNTMEKIKKIEEMLNVQNADGNQRNINMHITKDQIFQLRQSLLTNNDAREHIRTSLLNSQQQQKKNNGQGSKSQMEMPFIDNPLAHKSMGGGDILRMILQDQKSYIQSTTEELDYDGKENNGEEEGQKDTEKVDESGFLPKLMLNQDIDGNDFQFNKDKVRPNTGLVEVHRESNLNSSVGSATLMTSQNANQQRKQRQKPRDFNEIDSLIFGEAVLTTEVEIDVEEERPLQQHSARGRPVTTTNRQKISEDLMEDSFQSEQADNSHDNLLSRRDTRRKKWGGKANQSNVDQILKIQIKEEEDDYDEDQPSSIVVPDGFFNVSTPSNLVAKDGFRRLSMVKDAEFDIKACRNDSFAGYSNPSIREIAEQIREEVAEQRREEMAEQQELESGNDASEKYGDLNYEQEDDDPIMKLLQTNPELRQSLEQSLRKNNMLANRMQKVGVSPLRQKQFGNPIGNVANKNQAQNEQIIDNLVATIAMSSKRQKSNKTSPQNRFPHAASKSREKDDNNMHNELDQIQMLLMNQSINSMSPSKPQMQAKPRQRQSVKNDLPDSENDEEETNMDNMRLSQNTGHFAKAKVLEQKLAYDAQQQADPIDMITQLLNQNKTAGRDEIQQLIQQHQRLSNVSNKSRDLQGSQNKPVRENIVFGRKRSPMNGE